MHICTYIFALSDDPVATADPAPRCHCSVRGPESLGGVADSRTREGNI